MSPSSTRYFLAVFVVCAVVCAGVAVRAALPTFWRVSTESEFLEGDIENVSVDAYGRLTLGPAATPLYESSAPFLWTRAIAPDGSVFVGSGNEGQVYRVDVADNTARQFATTAERCLGSVVDADGNLYAAQFYRKASADLENLPAQIAAGNLSGLLGWLREHIYSVGQRRTAAELVQDVTGEPLCVDYLMEYLEGKFKPLYGLS